MIDDRQLGSVLDLLVHVAKAFVDTAGPTCEVAVYDLRTPQHTVHGVYGGLSGLSVGDHTTVALPNDIVGWDTGDVGAQSGIVGDGRFKTSTVWIRDSTGQVSGAITIKCDFSDIETALSSLARLLPSASHDSPEFGSDSVGGVALDRIEVAVQKAIEARRKPLRDFERNDHVAVIGDLDQAGVFAIRRSKDIVAHELRISRASVYAYLRAARESRSKSDAAVS